MFGPDYLKEIDFTKYKRIVVAYSGGVDSLVLLHALSLIPECKQKLFALHVNHGLSRNSSSWQNHCEQMCASLGVHFAALETKFSQGKRVSENVMREARYKALLSWTKKEDVLCTGHQKDDHVETVFFRLMRGTGIKGLSGIEQFSQMGGIDLVRPLINFPKKDLQDYARLNKLSWIEDESNEDLSISRNFIRKKILPSLKNKNWPSYLNSLSYLSRKAKEANEILEEVADLDINQCSIDSLNRLSILKIKDLSKARGLNLLFRWLRLKTDLSISSHLIEEVYKNLIFAKESSDPAVSFGKPGKEGSFQIRRFNGILHHLPLVETSSLNGKEKWSWNLQSPLVLPTGTLSMEPSLGIGLSSVLSQKGILIKARTGGERCKPQGRSKSQKLKKLLQEYKVPPWARDRLPLIYIDNELAAVSDLWVCEEFTAKKNEKGLLLNWSDNLDNI